MKINKRLEKITEQVLIKLRDKNLSNLFLNVSISVLMFLYIMSRFKYVNTDVPFWYTKIWGDSQMAPKFTLYMIPIVSVAISLVGLILSLLNKFYARYLEEIIWYSTLFVNVILFVSVVRIMRIASVPFKPILDAKYMNLLPVFISAFIVTSLLLPPFIEYAKRKKLITNPQIHNHPGMVLQTPSARGGGFIYSLVFTALSVIFVGVSKKTVGLYISVLMTGVLGFIDDYQNTHPKSGYRIMENPVLRLFLLFICVFPVVMSGILIYTISNPFGGFVNLNILEINIGDNVLPLIPFLVTALWIVWLMNVLSWSNGVDGQFPGIVGIASVLIAILSLRFKNLDKTHVDIATMAAVSAGVAFGSVKYNWHPSKIMWGFGAMSAGLVIASLAIYAQAKITVSVLILLIPFLDALITVIRRVSHGKSPFRGDRGHLHHILLDRGWSVSKVATFYWVATFIFGLIGLLSPENIVLKITLLIMGVVAFGIILLTARLNIKKKS